MKKYIFCSIFLLFLFLFLLLSLLIPHSKAMANDVCAIVKIEILQEMTFERQAFEARMKINNGYESSSLDNIRIDISLVDDEGAEKTDLFFISLTSKTGLSGEPDGSGSITSGGSAEIYWLLIPAKEAAGDTPLGKRYFAGSTFGYTIMGEKRTIDVSPDMIQVLPQPYLKLDYFLPGQVYGDDPFTEVTESAIPFNLGVRIHNRGLGPANKLKIDSGQPKIVENVLGLLIDFKIIGSSVNDQPATNSLLINFGDLQSQHCAIGRWIMISTLTGNFIEFDATLTHADYLGGEMTSLVDYNIGTHFLLHDILIDLRGSDTIRDFLTRDLKIYPSEPSYDSNSREIIRTAEDLSPSCAYTGSISAYDLCLEISGTAFGANPFIYIKKEDLSQGHLRITRVLRKDGKTLPEENYWIAQTSIDNGHTWTYHFHIFDTSDHPIQNPSYCLSYDEIIDTNPPHTLVIIGDPKVGENPVYVSRDTQFTFRADDTSEDGSSGIKDMRLALDSESEGPAPNPFMFSQRMNSAEGPHTLAYRSIDNMGNEEPPNILSIVLDLTPPLIHDAWVIPQTIMPGAPPELPVARQALIALRITDQSGQIDVQIDIANDNNFAAPKKRIKKRFPSGSAEIPWNGKDNANTTLAPDLYHIKITASDLLGNIATHEGLSIAISSSLAEGPISDGHSRLRLYKVSKSTNTQDQINPAISGDTIVWQDHRNGNWDIYKFDGTLTRITTDPSAQEHPAISGNTIVWQDYRSGNWDIYYKQGSNPETVIILPGDQINPAISGNHIVFEQNGNIFLYTIGGSAEQITRHIRDQILPQIDQDTIVWQDSRYGDPLIYAYNITTKTETQITPIDEERHTQHLSPAIYGDSILWTDNRAGNYDIYLYSLSDESAHRLTYGPGDQTAPKAYGDHFVYIDNSDIAFGSAITTVSEKVLLDPFDQKNVSLSGNGPYTIVWQDNRSGHWEIYKGIIDQEDFRMALNQGLNLISLPAEKFPASRNASELFTTLHTGNAINRLIQYDRAGGEYHTIDGTGGEFTLDPRAALALYAAQPGIISIQDMGDQGDIDLYTGFNQIGLANFPSGFTAYDLIDSLGLSDIKMIQKFSGADQRYMTVNITPEGEIIGGNFPIHAGDGLTIIMRRPITGWRPGRL